MPRGGPDGGDGGKGGDIIIQASENVQTLLDLVFQREYRAERGRHGKGKNQTGRSGKDLIIKVPYGTVIKDAVTGETLADLTKHGERVIVARGGRGGRGNARFATPTNQAPVYAEPGEPGEEKELRLELKLLADVGIIGMPNVGKSTLISVISSAKPKIADYPFTTLVPNLGVVRVGDVDFVVADVPGLIPGAHRGSGLGHSFLRHVERTRLLIHMLEVPSNPDRNPVVDFFSIQKELKLFNKELASKPTIVVLNKMDLPGAEEALANVEKELGKAGLRIFPVSAATKEGVDDLIKAVAKMVADIRSESFPEPETAPEENFLQAERH